MAKNIFEPIGNTDPKCPYCSYLLEQKPAQKKKCPNCGNYIYVRTRPSDREKILVTEAQIALVEEQWNLYYEQNEKEKIENDPEYMSAKQMLMKKWGKEPSVNDVKWSLANHNLIRHSKDNNWGLYRNTRLDMAGILYKEKRLKEALRIYLEVFYIDVNGPSNRGGISDPLLLKQHPQFDPKQSFIAPAVVAYIQELGDELGLSNDDLKNLFIEVANSIYSSLRLPVDPISAWKKLHSKVQLEIP